MSKSHLYSIETERAVLGTMLLRRDICELGLTKLKEESFWDERNAEIYKTIRDMREKMLSVDTVSLVAYSGKRISKMGGAAYVSELINNSTVGMFKDYLLILHDKQLKRSLRSSVYNVLDTIDSPAHFNESVSYLQSSLVTIMENSESRIKTMADLRIEADARRELAKNKNGIIGISTGFTAVDNWTGGLEEEDLVIICGRPSMGKTQFALQIGYNMSLSGNNVLLFSVEMGGRQLFTRMLSAETAIEYKKIRRGILDDEEMFQIDNVSDAMESSRLLVDDNGSGNIDRIVSQIRLAVIKYGIKVVIIDHLQLLYMARDVTKNEEYDYITRVLKAVAKELHIVIILLSQLSRAVENRASKRPLMSDLRESGAIEQNADIIIGIYRDEYYQEFTDKVNIAEIIFLKYREGGTGTVELAFLKDIVKFANLQYLGEM